MASTILEDSTKRLCATHHNTHFMLIDGMSKLMSRKVESCQSLDIDISGIKWNLLIRSNLVTGYLSFYLRISDEKCTGSNWVVSCNMKPSLVSKTGQNDAFSPKILFYKENDESQGIDSFVSHTVLKDKYLVQDKAVFGVEISVVLSSFPAKPHVHRTMGTAERVKLMDIARENSKFTWKITQFSSFNGTSHSSYEFTVGPRRWKLLMYPKGTASGVGHFSLFLTATEYTTNGPKGSTVAVTKLRLLDQLKRNHLEYDLDALYPNTPNEIKRSWGYAKFLSLDELNKPSRGFLVNDEMYISVEFLIVSTTENL